MNFKLILGLVCTAISVGAMAIHEECLKDISLDECNKCDKFAKKVTDMGRDYISNSLFECSVNDIIDGEIQSLSISNVEQPIYDLAKYANVRGVGTLELHGILVDQEIIDFIGSLRSLYLLDIQGSSYERNLDWSPLKNLTRLRYLKIWDINYREIKEFPESIYSLTNLEELVFSNQAITTISDSISNLKNLKTLVMEENKIKMIPKAICQLKNLEKINFNGNKIKNPPSSIKEFCMNEETTTIDLPSYIDDSYNNEETTATGLPISKNSKCGKREGTRCPDGECCSKYNICGNSNFFCGSGCQSEFGRCN